MNKCEEFLENKEKFKWFIVEYFGESIFYNCIEYATNAEEDKLLNLLNLIWFRLPDHLFNIRVNPNGWSEFLNILEE